MTRTAATPGARPNARRRGAAAVEFAVVAPVFFLLIFGIIDIGRGMMTSSLLTNAARAGCRVAVIDGKSDSDVKAAVDATVKGQGMSTPTTSVKVNGKTANASTAVSRDLITVSVSVPVNEVSWLPTQWFVKGNITGQFTLQRE